MNMEIFKEIILFGIIAFLSLTLNKYRNLLRKQKERNKILKDEINKINESTVIKNEMIIRVSHDMRTPISNIIMLLDLMKNNVNDKEKIVKYLKKIENPAQYLLGLSNDIVDMRKIEMGDIELVDENINMKNVILDSFSMVEDKMKAKGIKFSRNIDRIKHTSLIGDNLRLKQIFINILVNAINHTPEGGKITFSAKEVKRIVENGNAKVSIEFKISDNGEGMNTEFLEHIWEAYSKDNNSCFKNIGTGLGMAITKQYINLMDGKITVRSEIGAGSVFTINLTFNESIKIDPKKKLVGKIA